MDVEVLPDSRFSFQSALPTWGDKRPDPPGNEPTLGRSDPLAWIGTRGSDQATEPSCLAATPEALDLVSAAVRVGRRLIAVSTTSKSESKSWTLPLVGFGKGRTDKQTGPRMLDAESPRRTL